MKAFLWPLQAQHVLLKSFVVLSVQQEEPGSNFSSRSHPKVPDPGVLHPFIIKNWIRNRATRACLASPNQIENHTFGLFSLSLMDRKCLQRSFLFVTNSDQLRKLVSKLVSMLRWKSSYNGSSYFRTACPFSVQANNSITRLNYELRTVTKSIFTSKSMFG